VADLDYLRELIQVLHRAELSSLFGEDGTRPLVCIRTEDGDMLRIVDVEVVADEIDAHVEIRVIPDAPEPADTGDAS
jgi:hypothetical protein